MKRVVILFLLLLIFATIFMLNKYENYTQRNAFDNIDAVIYINLDHRKDRKKQIEHELKRMGVSKNKIIRLPAVYEEYNGHLGCSKSHNKVMNMIQNTNYNTVLVIEDDFIFTVDKETLHMKLNHFFDTFKDDWDACHLTASYKSTDYIDKHIHKCKSAMTSSAYIVNNKKKTFIEKLKESFEDSIDKLTRNMEEVFKKEGKKKITQNGAALNQNWGDLQKESKWYIFMPYLGEQGGEAGGSSIMSNLDNERKRVKSD